MQVVNDKLTLSKVPVNNMLTNIATNAANNVTKAVSNTVKNAVGTPSGGSSKPATTTASQSTAVAQPAQVSAPTYTAPQFTASQAYVDAMNYTNGLLQQLSSGRTSYTDQVKAMMDKITNRDPFSYDADKDQLFQQYLSSMQNTGKAAMQDTIGQASALTGGYGSTYATTAGNNAYNAYLQQAYDNLPEYYNTALNAYQTEGENMYRQYGMLSDADNQEYERLYNAYTNNFNNAQQMYANELNAFSTNSGLQYNYDTLNNSNYWNAQDMAYKYAQANKSSGGSGGGSSKSSSSSKTSSSGTGSTKLSTVKQEALKEFNSSGYNGLFKVLDKYDEFTEEELQEINDYINEYNTFGPSLVASVKKQIFK